MSRIWVLASWVRFSDTDQMKARLTPVIATRTNRYCFFKLEAPSLLAF